MNKILIIDDEKDICFLISEILKDENYLTYSALNSDEAIAKFNELNPDLVILDVWLSNSKLDGIEILKEFKKNNNNVPVIIISGHGTVDLAVKAIKNGAYDFIEKPFNSDKLLIITKRAIESSALINENIDLKNILSVEIPLIGKSNFITKIFKNIKNHSISLSRLFIYGEYGTGKKLISNIIHKQSEFKNKLPVSIDFSQVSNQNIEKLFTEDIKNINENLFVRGNNNTLLLLNLDLLPINYQKKLLFYIENPSFFKKINIELKQKIITITEKNLLDEIEKGNFLKRLYERICVDYIFCPSLCDRREDIKDILNFYISYFSKGNKNFNFSKSAMTKLEMFDWPGNVAQLINYVEKTVILNQGRDVNIELDLDDLALEMGEFNKENSNLNNLDMSLKDARSEFEREYLLSQIKRFNGNMSKVSEFTGMERTALYRKIKSLNISLS
ncbi:MAG: Nitrogen regulation protein NR(I) [Alphaproteobacteria bacterium MarineAlpha5_Bin5]|nr:MAG: Nitrogen regulation protein NR(I) [Alphaproteobacteria bacterium MarineAlpha5_Bin5]PPR49405.1 MAG: Nitrogen regulation protein NR(I) [Alphaproteobacteria bacterium MarineAlpha5_Bin4]|tara:strand:- start:6844 stop:8178 length:1335 start_codon:yes stop_codon:yes gene_type:complete